MADEFIGPFARQSANGFDEKIEIEGAGYGDADASIGGGEAMALYGFTECSRVTAVEKRGFDGAQSIFAAEPNASCLLYTSRCV